MDSHQLNPQDQPKNPEILVATPGRLIDLFRQNALKLDQLQTLVLD